MIYFATRFLQSEVYRLQQIQRAAGIGDNDLPKYEDVYPDGPADDRVVQVSIL